MVRSWRIRHHSIDEHGAAVVTNYVSLAKTGTQALEFVRATLGLASAWNLELVGPSASGWVFNVKDAF